MSCRYLHNPSLLHLQLDKTALISRLLVYSHLSVVLSLVCSPQKLPTAYSLGLRSPKSRKASQNVPVCSSYFSCPSSWIDMLIGSPRVPRIRLPDVLRRAPSFFGPTRFVFSFPPGLASPNTNGSCSSHTLSHHKPQGMNHKHARL